MDDLDKRKYAIYKYVNAKVAKLIDREESKHQCISDITEMVIKLLMANEK